MAVTDSHRQRSLKRYQTLTPYAPLAGLALVCLLLPHTVMADEPTLTSAAKELLNSVVTVRVPVAGNTANKEEPRVIVCSGVIVDPHWVVTPVFAGADSQVRLTLPGGRQVTGRVRVLDEYSGLAMVRLDEPVMHSLRLAAKLAPVGSWVLSAAGWGVERPVVSLGIVSALNRTDPGLGYPPLLQCDLRAATTSSGAAVVNDSGELLGIVVAAGKATDQGWTFAVPVAHVARLLRVAQRTSADDSLTILKRRRPEVGMVLDGQQDAVRVSRITPNGPADQAGVHVGDRVVAVNGVHIRSVYQAVRPVVVLQPGDRIVLTVERDGISRDIPVVLGGGVEIPRGRLVDVTRFIQPKVEFSQRDWELAQLKKAPNVRELNADAPHLTEQARQAEAQALLEKSLVRYQQALRAMQEQLKKSESQRKALEKEIDSLRRDFEALKRQANIPPNR